MSEILGQGQFGDVYGGHYAHPCGTDIPVAVKTCKLEAGEGTAEKILEEACKFEIWGLSKLYKFWTPIMMLQTVQGLRNNLIESIDGTIAG